MLSSGQLFEDLERTEILSETVYSIFIDSFRIYFTAYFCHGNLSVEYCQIAAKVYKCSFFNMIALTLKLIV